MRMMKLVSNAVIVFADSILMIDGPVAVAVLVLGAVLVLVPRKLNPRRARESPSGTTRTT